MTDDDRTNISVHTNALCVIFGVKPSDVLSIRIEPDRIYFETVARDEKGRIRTFMDDTMFDTKMFSVET